MVSFLSFSNFLESKFLPVAAKIGAQKHLQAVRDGLIVTMPLTIAGSLFLILANLPIPGYPELMSGIFGEHWAAKLSYPVRASFDLMALFGCIGIAYRLAEKNKVDMLSAVALSVMTFFILTPYRVPFTYNDTTTIVEAIPLVYTGSAGLFGAMVSAIFATEMYSWFIRKNIVISLPENVPPAVAKSFVALIPTVVLMVICLVIRIGLEASSFEHLHNLMSVLLTTPLSHLTSSWIGVMIIIMLIQLFWIAGLHGCIIVLGIIGPVMTVLGDQNRLAYESGQEIPNILGGPFWDLFVNIGGGGGTFALAFLLAFASKSTQLKEVGKLSVGPACFGINEPIIFGLPIVMNPYLIIPFFFTPLVTGTIGYSLMAFDILPKFPGIAIPWTTPPVINAYVSSLGNIWWPLVQIGLIIIGLLIYLPFFKIYDKKILTEELAYKAQEEAAAAQVDSQA